MQTIEVTDEQYRYVQRLREAIAEEIVGQYGHVRTRDAIQYLIDTNEGVTDPLGAGSDTAEEHRSEAVDQPSVSFDESTEDDEGSLGPEHETEEPPASVEDDHHDDETDATGDETSGETDATEDEIDGETGATEDESATAGDADSSGDGAADDDDMLNEMMSLLDTYAEKWDESDSADYRYSVELPDGTVEDVQTKDDVRALLFRHYR